MIVLDTTNDKIQVVLGGTVTTNQLDCYAAWRDITTTTYVPGKNAPATNNTTDVDLVAAPAASTQRVVDYLSVYNRDTAAATVTIKHDLSATERILWKGLLLAGEKLEYVEGEGFQVFSDAGIPKAVQVPVGAVYTANLLNTTVLGSDVTNNNAVANTIADVTGLSFAVVAGETYWFRFVIRYTSAATATGSRWTINGPGSPTALAFKVEVPLIATVNSTDATSDSHAIAYDTPATANATSPNNTAPAGGQIVTIEGFIKPSANGTVIARFSSEVASSAIIAKAGSFVNWMRTL